MKFLFFTLFLLLNSTIAFSLDIPFETEGKQYLLQLKEVAHSPDGAIHYKGVAEGEENSWVRATQFSDQRWEGLVSISDELKALTVTPITPLNTKTTFASALLYQDVEQSCATRHPQTNHTHTELFEFDRGEQIAASFTTECNGNLVDDVCVYADLELVFDQEFQTAYPVNTQDNVDALVNMLEGYFLEQLNIGFSVISQTFLTNATDIYSNTTNANDLLDELFSRRCEQRFGATDCARFFSGYDGLAQSGTNFEENASIAHLVTGRDLDGTTAGVAFIDTLCNSDAFNVGLSQLSYNFQGNPDNITLAATASTIAHEIGHNFGAYHDGQQNDPVNSEGPRTPENAISCAAGFIMEPSFSRTNLAEAFSTCSENTLTGAMADHITESCATAPIDLVITSGSVSGTPTSFTNFTINSAFSASVSEIGFRNTGSANIKLTASGATLQSATIGASSCTVSNDQTSADCLLSASTPLNQSQSINVQLSLTDANVTLTASDERNNTYLDTDNTNSRAQLSITPVMSSFTISANTIALTTSQRPLISGTTTLPNSSQIQVRNGSTLLCTATSSGSSWSCTPSSNLPQGLSTLSISGPSGEMASTTVTVDSIAPTISLNAIDVNSSARPTLSGNVNISSSEGNVSVRRNGITICSVGAFSSGAWSCTATVDLSANDTIIATATDTAGNQNTASQIVTNTAPTNNTSSGGGDSGGGSIHITLLLSLLILNLYRVFTASRD